MTLPRVQVKTNLLDPAPKIPHAGATLCTSDDHGLEGARVDGHRDSALTIYCFNGAFRCGKTLNVWNVLLSCIPGHVYVMDPISVAAQNNCISLPKLVLLSSIPLVLLHGAAEDSTFVGWSFGCRAASSSASFLNACLSVSRALTMLDDRRTSPVALSNNRCES